jgi:hypothetical protein
LLRDRPNGSAVRRWPTNLHCPRPRHLAMSCLRTTECNVALAHDEVQDRACARTAMTRSRASTGRLCAVLDFHPGQSPERSPLHDVRQHAPSQANPAGCENVYFWTSHALGHDRHKTATHRAATRMKRKKAVSARRERLNRGDRRSGGARRDRTDDLLLAKQALSQLSYGPVRHQ